MTNSMVEWFLAQLDVDEQLVRAVEEEVGTYRAGEPYEDGSGIATNDAYPSYPWGQSDVELQFMARWHPRAVLADIAAKREAVEICWHYIQHEGHSGSQRAGVCEDVLRALVSGLAHRDGYDPSWAPQ